MRRQRLLSSLAGLLVSALAGAQNFVEFPFPADSEPWAITAGPDGNLWFTEGLVGNKIGRITTTGVVTEFPIPTFGSSPNQGITVGPDGNLWFTEHGSGKVGRITTTGAITEFPVAPPFFSPDFITTGPDGNLWFTEQLGNSIGRMTTTGVVTGFPIPPLFTPPAGPTSSGTFFITAGPDGNLWFAETHGNKIGRITTAGVITEFSVPTAASGPYGIALGPDGNLWFTELFGNKIGRITTKGIISEFPIPTSPSLPYGIVSGPDGNLWFTEAGVNNSARIGRITTAGVITEFPAGNLIGVSITAGPDGNLWFTTSRGIGRISTVPDRLCLSEKRLCAQATWRAASQATGSGPGIALPITANTGAFWFFEPTNLELVVKVLDGRSINGRWWIFYGSLTNVEFTLTVADTETGATKTYFNPQGQLASVADTSAF